jgi:hypothetical protein
MASRKLGLGQALKIAVFEYRPPNEMFRGIHEAQAESDGQTFIARIRNGIEMKLARMLVEAGAPDQPARGRPRLPPPKRMQILAALKRSKDRLNAGWAPMKPP